MLERCIRLLTAVIFATALFAGSEVVAQYKGNPVKKDKLLNVLRSKQLQTREIVGVIKSNGVEFRVTPAVEQELYAAGARPEVIAAAKQNYRGPAGSNSRSPDEFETYNTQSSVADLERAVQTRSTGNLSYLNYQQLGYRYLLMKNYPAAEQSMREAMRRGGSGVFPVHHDHNGTFTQGCSGFIYVSSAGVRFESQTDVSDSFDIPDASIRKISMNSGFLNVFRAKKGSFQVKLDGRNYNFAPVSGNDTESKMLIKLVGK